MLGVVFLLLLLNEKKKNVYKQKKNQYGNR